MTDNRPAEEIIRDALRPGDNSHLARQYEQDKRTAEAKKRDRIRREAQDIDPYGHRDRGDVLGQARARVEAADRVAERDRAEEQRIADQRAVFESVNRRSRNRLREEWLDHSQRDWHRRRDTEGETSVKEQLQRMYFAKRGYYQED